MDRAEVRERALTHLSASSMAGRYLGLYSTVAA